MCFSAVASFSAGAVLTVAGIITTQLATSKAQLPFAAIPFLFGLQQFSEGFVWLSLTHTQYAHWQQAATYTFLFFAHVLWPVWIPFSALLFEQMQPQKNIIFAFFLLGFALAMGEIFCLTSYHTEARIYGHHIEYLVTYPVAFITISKVVYGITTLISCFICSYKKMRWFAGVLAISLMLTNIFYKAWLISVWCFFAALLSIVIYYILFQQNKRQIAIIV